MRNGECAAVKKGNWNSRGNFFALNIIPKTGMTWKIGVRDFHAREIVPTVLEI